ncbi:GNAT family N-acetyltransferase [Paenibacillus thalictri]|uniref:GNAT family N-acetyltransferase n=1 Tax=Paenibacillus thalictri TaxID=2527873 RepID=A0A4Q9DH72_9BACL|nr:GNAT family N-acetyltransferase [Paenibacillus thalictri]TBL71179.1 GNAT family N-acetyltransferase [Paenibacillus thalictri]
MRIRRLTPDDAQAFWTLRMQGLMQYPEAFGSSYEEAAATPLDKVRGRLSVSSENAVFGAFTEHGELIGVAGIYGDHAAKMRHKAGIWGVYVAPSGQGRGIGRQLMETALAYARTIPHWELVLLAVSSSNHSAKKLYESLGFRTYGVEPCALKMNGICYDEDLMMMKL